MYRSQFLPVSLDVKHAAQNAYLFYHYTTLNMSSFLPSAMFIEDAEGVGSCSLEILIKAKEPESMRVIT